jgi:hypothetical protein
MRYLFAALPEESADAEQWAPAGEPVVPQFPHTGTNHWLSVTSFKPAPAAVVEERDMDLDELATRLVAEYPGLPEELHHEYILRTAKLAHMVPVGSLIQIFITRDQAKVLVRDTEEWIELWNRQPLP